MIVGQRESSAHLIPADLKDHWNVGCSYFKNVYRKELPTSTCQQMRIVADLTANGPSASTATWPVPPFGDGLKGVDQRAIRLLQLQVDLMIMRVYRTLQKIDEDGIHILSLPPKSEDSLSVLPFQRWVVNLLHQSSIEHSAPQDRFGSMRNQFHRWVRQYFR